MNNGNIDDLAIDLIIYLNMLATKYQNFSDTALDKVKPFSNEKIAIFSVGLFESTKTNVKVIRNDNKFKN